MGVSVGRGRRPFLGGPGGPGRRQSRGARFGGWVQGPPGSDRLRERWGV